MQKLGFGSRDKLHRPSGVMQKLCGSGCIMQPGDPFCDLWRMSLQLPMSCALLLVVHCPACTMLRGCRIGFWCLVGRGGRGSLKHPAAGTLIIAFSFLENRFGRFCTCNFGFNLFSPAKSYGKVSRSQTAAETSSRQLVVRTSLALAPKFSCPPLTSF